MTHPTGKLALLTSLLLFASSSLALLSVSVDRTRISEADTLRLSIRVDNPQSIATPDFSLIETDFEIVRSTGPNQNSRYSIINGRQTSEVYVTWELTLRARRLGKLTIPSMQFGNERSESIVISVVPQTRAMKQRMDQYVFFDTSVDHTETYVQGQIIYTIKLYYVEGLSGDFPTQPEIRDVVIEPIENERRYDAFVNNRRYYVLEKSYAVYPQRSGELFIPKQTFSGTRGGSRFFSTSRQRVNAISESHSIKVKPRPSSFPGEHWLPARSLVLSESWSEVPPVFKVGEPINRSLTITVDGLADSLLPPFRDLEISGTKTYTDPAVKDQQISPRGIISTSTTTVGIVPVSAGPITIPELRIPWWNTDTDSLEIATIPAASFIVLDSNTGLLAPPLAPKDEIQAIDQISKAEVTTVTSPFWMYTSAILALIWLTTLLLWWRQHQRVSNGTVPEQQDSTSSEVELLRHLKTACSDNQAATAGNLLFMWGKARFPTIDSTRELARITNSTALANEINNLEACLYSPAGNQYWRGNSLRTILEELETNKPEQTKKPPLTERLNPV